MNLHRFTQPEVLYEIGTELLCELFDRFKEELESKHIAIPNPNLADGHYYESVADLFKSPATLPATLVEAVMAVEELADPANKPRLEAAFAESPLELYIQPDSSPEYTALKLWLNCPYPTNAGRDAFHRVPDPPAPRTAAVSTLRNNAMEDGPAAAPPPLLLGRPVLRSSTAEGGGEGRGEESPALPIQKTPPPLPPAAVPKRPALAPPVIAASGYRRQGKVARLPKEARDKINFLLLDGLSYSQIIKTLGPEGAGLNEDNLSNWKLGGYQEWLTEQKDMEDMHLREEYTLQLVKENGGTTLNEATIKMATTQIRQALRAFGQGVLQTALEENSQNYIRLINALARLTTGAITCQHHRVKEDERQANLEKANADPASLAITPETLRKIEELLRIR